MQLYWLGYSSIKIEGKVGDAECTLVTDPYQNEASLRFPKTVNPDILVLSNQDTELFNLEPFAEKPPFTISTPGEFEVKGAFVQGIQVDDSIIYRFVIEGMAIGFLGSIQRELNDVEIEQLGSIDILILPAGGIAQKLLTSIEPRMVIPIQIDIPGIKTKLETADAFCKKMGACKRVDANKLKIVRKDLPSDELVVTVLERL